MRRGTPSEETTLNLDELIDNYAFDKQSMDNYKKICDAQNKQIKGLMADLGLDSYQTNDWKVTCSTSERTTVDEEKLLNLLWKIEDLPSGIIKTKEYVDMDALEKAVYNGTLDKDVLIAMDSCVETKEIVTLRLSKAKAKKEED